MGLLTSEEWDHFTNNHPRAHILQTSAWGSLKAKFGWSPRFIHHQNVGAMVLFRRLPLGFSIGYIPRGPVGEREWEHLWSEIDQLCQKERAIFLRVEPNVWQPSSNDIIARSLPGFVQTEQTIQPPRTVLIDLQPDEEDLLMAMKSKTRYNIRLAERKEVTVHQSQDVSAFHRMMLTTGARDEFGTHSLAYYQLAYDLFAPQDACVLLIAQYDQQPLAGLMAFAHGETAWYFYGASTNQERNRMPTYLLQWEAMRWAKQRGCKTYDMWGVPDHPENQLEESFMNRSDGLWGVYRFKRGFGGEIRRTVGAWDRIYRSALYSLVKLWMGRNQSPSA